MFFFLLMKSITLYFTRSLNNIIGRENEFLWFLNKDTSDFKEKTTGQIVLMGKRAWETIPSNMKPYSHCKTIIVTRDRDFTYYHENVDVYYDLDCFIKQYLKDNLEVRKLWIIGGGDILQQCLKYATDIEINEINSNITGEVLGPLVPKSEFILRSSSELLKDSFTGLEYFKTIFKRSRNHVQV